MHSTVTPLVERILLLGSVRVFCILVKICLKKFLKFVVRVKKLTINLYHKKILGSDYRRNNWRGKESRSWRVGGVCWRNCGGTLFWVCLPYVLLCARLLRSWQNSCFIEISWHLEFLLYWNLLASRRGFVTPFHSTDLAPSLISTNNRIWGRYWYCQVT